MTKRPPRLTTKFAIVRLEMLVKTSSLIAFLVVAAANVPAYAQVTASCSAIADPAARLACYDRANAAPRTPDGSQSPRWPEFNSAPGPLPGTRPAPNAPALSQNGKLVAGVTSFSFSRSRRFAVTLDNGQTWRQLDADDGIAQFRDHSPNRVVITHGFWRSYDLRLNDMSAVFKVQRVK